MIVKVKVVFLKCIPIHGRTARKLTAAVKIILWRYVQCGWSLHGTARYVMSRYSVDTEDSLDIIYTQISDPRQCLVYSRHHRDWVLLGWSHASDRGRAECKVQTEFTFIRAYLLRRPFSLQR